ncbi:Trehalose-6-phosphate phosphatase [Neorhizobium galegae bv. officinalis bv. officinalis str. HAMBI 1141]|uniref:Trehalose 6-phosphate phosphatase n=1 Tax=Neorhizobium galegae bv. officinalis bv. officinalis str. HAMBI 1141 TaxID=1028801 RepID=A0A068TH57_NEOGA|nr:trehalose-phosphatase [Neorhizobium galegae]CDN56825.1 Trehalose-6-phosphate phosphatase [Neorhizobium galegae bv. officinalis bv. officinalis str. HAMBI 1141]
MSRKEQPSPATAEAPLPGDPVLARLMLEPERWALFLDIDGTLIELAETPDAIVVPPDLPENLHRLSMRLGGALALVTGRALPYADQLFTPYKFPIAGLHGSERRDPSGAISRVEIGAAFEDLKAALVREAHQWPGVLVEDKGAAVAAHYRQAPKQREAVEAAMPRYLDMAGPDFTLQHGKMVMEIRPAQASKGHALQAFLDQPPFKGRKPIAIGDDVTDEAMFRTANQLGGHSIRITETPGDTEAKSTLPSAAALRAAIKALASGVKPDAA